MAIINLTQHPATEAQLEEGVLNLCGDTLAEVISLITFFDIPSVEEMSKRALRLAEITDSLIGVESTTREAMIGGAGFFMAHLEAALKQKGITPLHAFSQREVIETTGESGEVVKKAVFRHMGFVGR